MATPDYIGMALEEMGDIEHYGVKGMKWGVRKKDGSGTIDTLGVLTLSEKNPAHVGLKSVNGDIPQHDKKSKSEHEKVLNAMGKTLRAGPNVKGSFMHPDSEMQRLFKQRREASNGKPLTDKEVDKFYSDTEAAMTRDAQKLAPEGSRALVVIRGLRTAVVFVGSPEDIGEMSKNDQFKHSSIDNVAQMEIELEIDEDGYITGIAENELLHYGIKGMKWGVRRTDAQLAAAGSKSSKPSSSGGSEAAQRYERIKAQAKAGKASDLSEEDLKWFNARTEALGKINKLTQKNPNWLKQTTNEVLKGVAKKSYQSIAEAAVKKFVTDPLTEKINLSGTKTLSFQERVQKAAKESVDKSAFENAVKTAIEKNQPKGIEPSFEAKVRKAAEEAAAKKIYEEAVKAETKKLLKKQEEDEQ